VSDIPDDSLTLLDGLDVLMLDCLRYKPHPTHISVEQSIAYAGLIKARRTYLIHMTHELEYEKLSAELPKNIHVAYDGLKLNF
jgi:phosphoribosyl 1,2-cyclic phosphate phosphodiesterase